MTDLRDHPTSGRASRGRESSLRLRLWQLTGSERLRWWLVFVVLATLAAVRAATTMERDPYWSARAGAENLSGVPLVRVDSWSWSAEGVWYPNSPAWNLMLGAGWQGLGFWGLFTVGFAAMTLMFALALALSRLAGARALPTLVGFMPLLLVATSGLSPRATVVVQCLIFAAVLFGWWWGRVVLRIPVSVALAGVAVAGFLTSLLGNWVHLSFMLMAAAIALLWAISWWATPGINSILRLALAASGTVGLLLGCFLSPYGIPVTVERMNVVASVCRDLITEWMSVSTFLANGRYQVVLSTVLILAMLTVCLVWVVSMIRMHGRFDPRVRFVLPLAVFGAVAVLAGLATVRFIAVGALALLPVAAGATTWLVDRARRHQRRGFGFWGRPKVVEYTSGTFLTVLVLVVGVVMSPLAGLKIATGARPPEAGVIASLPEGCNVWSQDRAAGPIILLRPDARVWIDGRVDFYGREHLLRYLRVLSGDEPLPEEADCVILATPSDGHIALAVALDENPDWSRVAQREGYTLWVRD